jgi:hypothetical protein
MKTKPEPKPITGVTTVALEHVIQAILSGLQKAKVMDEKNNVTVFAYRIPDHTGAPNVIRIDIRPC